jgi:hypothetical protein
LAKAKKEETNKRLETKPWLSWKSGIKFMIVVSAGLALWVGWQVASTEGLGAGILWGLGFGGSLWLVFFGMNFFHQLFGRKPKK